MTGRANYLGGLLAALISVALPQAGFAQDSRGETVAVIQQASLVGAGGQRMLAAQEQVFLGDRVNTGAAGEAQIQLRDGARLVVGANSSLVIDQFVSPASTGSTVSINLTKGALRFISGGNHGYTIKTPVATVGIRGTEFDCVHSASKGTACAVTGGVIKVCDRQGGCVDLDGKACGAAVVPPNGPVQQVSAANEKTPLLEQNFPYLKDQQTLKPGFTANVAACGFAYNPGNQQPGQPGQTAPPAGGAPPPATPFVVLGLASATAVTTAVAEAADDEPTSPLPH